MNLIDGTVIAKKIQEQIAHAISHLSHRKPGLAFILVGDNPSSQTYIRMKKKRCEEVGILSFDCVLPKTVTEEQLLKKSISSIGILLSMEFLFNSPFQNIST